MRINGKEQYRGCPTSTTRIKKGKWKTVYQGENYDESFGKLFADIDDYLSTVVGTQEAIVAIKKCSLRHSCSK